MRRELLGELEKVEKDHLPTRILDGIVDGEKQSVEKFGKKAFEVWADPNYCCSE